MCIIPTPLLVSYPSRSPSSLEEPPSHPDLSQNPSSHIPPWHFVRRATLEQSRAEPTVLETSLQIGNLFQNLGHRSFVIDEFRFLALDYRLQFITVPNVTAEVDAIDRLHPPPIVGIDLFQSYQCQIEYEICIVIREQVDSLPRLDPGYLWVWYARAANDVVSWWQLAWEIFGIPVLAPSLEVSLRLMHVVVVHDPGH